MEALRERLNKNKKLVILLLLSALIVLVGVSFAWLANMANNDLANIKGNTKYVKMYFESGSGTSSDPYIIAKPEQLNNLAWLQYLGYFNQAKNGTIPTTYFKLQPSSGTTLDMTGYVCPPIGTEKYPFLGNFNGNGCTVSKLTIRNSKNITKYSNPPSILVKEGNKNTVTNAGKIVGMFGVVGKYNSESYSVSANKVYKFHISAIKVYSEMSPGLAGLAVGYVNGTLENIGVVGSSYIMNASTSSMSFTSNVSDYSLVGYVADSKYLGNKVQRVVTDIGEAERTEQEEIEGGWDNSLDMHKLFDRVAAIDDNSWKFKYSVNQTIIRKNDGTITVEEGEPTVEHSSIREYLDEYNSFAFTASNATKNLGYQTLYGAKNITINKNVKTVRRTQSSKFQIIDGSRYLHTDGTSIIAMPVPDYAEPAELSDNDAAKDDTNKDPTVDDVIDTLDLKLEIVEEQASLDATTDAVYWEFEDNTTKTGFLKTTIGGKTYYLNRNGTDVYVSTTGETIWYCANNELVTSIGSTAYYLVYSETQSKWMLDAERTTKFIINNGAHYLQVNTTNPTVIGDTVDRDSATKWDSSGNIDAGEFMLTTKIGGTTYYLSNQNGTLKSYAGSNTSYQTKWSYDYDNDAIYNGDYYLQYKDGTWSLVNPPIIKSIKTMSGSNYLTVGGSSSSPTITNSSTSKTKWYYDSDKHLFAYVNGTKWYLSTSNYNLVLRSYADDTWTFSRYILSEKGYGYLTQQQTKRLRFTNSAWSTYLSLSVDAYKVYFNGSEPEYIPNSYIQTANIVSVAKLTINEEVDPTSESEEVTTVTQPGYYTTPETYFPIATNSEDSSSFAPDSTNVGYIVSGGQSDTDNSIASLGDIRLSSYGFVYRELYYSNNNTTTYSGNNRYLQVLTRTANSGGFVRVKDAINGGNIDDCDSTLATYPVKTVEELGFTRYNDAIVNYREILSNSPKNFNSEYMYGLHFMNAKVGLDNIAVIPYAIVNNKEYEEYQVPRNCIDVRVNSAGSMNFFAGSYYASAGGQNPNDCFFSLFQIFRDDNETITDIKKISKVYKVGNNKYEYQYSDGTTSGNISSGTLAFDTSWLENPGSDILYSYANLFNRGALYYFEIPVNKGEYALGSVDGKTAGAYLTYLDVCANNQTKNNITETEKIITTTEEYNCPKGVDFQASTTTSISSVKNSASIQLAPKEKSASTQSIKFTRKSNAISVSSFPGQKCVYKSSENITVQTTASTPVALEMSGTKTKEVREEILTEIKKNETTGDIESKTVTKLRTTLDGSGNVTKKEKWIDGQEQEDVTETVDITGFTSGLKYRYITATSTTVNTEMERTITGNDDDDDVAVKYTIKLTPSIKIIVYIEEAITKFAESTINGTTVTKDSKITINP